MYQILLPIHSIIRWLFVLTIFYSVARACWSVFSKGAFTQTDNVVRSLTSGLAHVQLIVGMILYFKSPITTFFRNNPAEAMGYVDLAFFGVFHISFMIIAIVLVTIGASKAKHGATDIDKHKQILVWFGLAAFLIFLAIPWPFHPYVNRPYWRPF